MTGQLRKKFIFINMALVGTVLLIVFIALCVQRYQQLRLDSLRVMERYFDDSGVQVMPELKFNKKREWKDFPLMLSFCALVDEDGNLLSYQSDNLSVSEETVGQAARAAMQEIERTGDESGTLSQLDLRYLKQDCAEGIKIAFVDRTQEYSAMYSFLRSSFFLGVGGLVALFFISYFLSIWVVQPVERSLRQQKQFVADASHELKTPLTVILANCGILLSHPQESIEQQEHWVRNTQEEAVNMKRLIDEMLYLARSDSAQQVVYSRLNLSDLVWSSVLPFESVAFEQGLQLESEITEDIFLQGDEGRLKQMVRILMDNACKYCAPGGTILVQLIWEKEQERAKLCVQNTLSEPIPQEELGRLFERFYRVDKARSREMGGYGLGLAIAQSIVERHRGKIFATQQVNTICFSATLPVRQTHTRRENLFHRRGKRKKEIS